MIPERTTVFLPCHTLDDFPTWLDEAEADELLSAWVAAWHPALVATVGSPPSWSSIDLPVPQGPLLGIVPAAWDDRFAAQFDAACTVGSSFVRRTSGVEAITRTAADRLGLPDAPLPGDRWAKDFQALGLASLLAELLARRMRTHADLDETGFPAAVVAAARAATEGRDDDAGVALQEAFDAISATRARYYPVDSYVVDLVLAAGTTGAEAFCESIDSPVPVALVMTGATVEHLAGSAPEALLAVRGRIADGRAEACGGRDLDTPMDLETPEALLSSFTAGIDQVQRHLGRPPASFARVTGGSAAILPQLLAGLGIEGGVWTLFDGTALPDVGGGLIRWQSGGAAADLLAAPPLDARSARMVLGLPESLGEALDRDHVAAILFAHYAGTARRWHGLLRRIGQRTNLLGTFITPRELARRAAGSGTPVSLEPDAFPPTPPDHARDPSNPRDTGDPIDLAVSRAIEQAAAIVAAAQPLLPPGNAAPAVSPRPAPPMRRWLSFGVPSGRRPADRLVLDNGLVRVEAHARTGGLLSLRRDADGANRLSQQLAIRTTRAAGGVGSGWESPEDRAVFTRMVADSVDRQSDGESGEAILSRGRLMTTSGEVAARFSQRLSLVDGMPVAVFEIEVVRERPSAGPLAEDHVAARFAWHENEPVEIRRSVLTQSIATERTRFTAPSFIEIVPEGARFDATADAVTILTGGLPWHLRSTPHVLDSILGGGATTTLRRRLAVGLGLPRPWDAALAFAGGGRLGQSLPGLPANVRLTVQEIVRGEGMLVGARVGLLESAGQTGAVTVDWGRPVTRATVVGLGGGEQAEPAVAIDGSRTVVSLARFQWLQLDLGFAG